MMKFARIFLIISILWQFGSASAQGSDAFFWNLYNDSTISFGNPAPLEPLSSDALRLFVWNVHKAADPRYAQDFADLTFGADIALLQETVSNKNITVELSAANPNFEWTMAKSFQQSDLAFTGVATGARVKALREEVIISEAREPLVETPKTILLSEFALENTSETLLVANIHGINFVSLESYKSQIRQLLEGIRNHQGPLVVAGDFNTWDIERWLYLQKAFAPVGLKHIKTPVAGILDLDHIFVRGMNARFVFDFSHIDSSDHAPLMVDLTYEINKVMIYENNK